jgi:galactose-1-phosphate uridylyltransferase
MSQINEEELKENQEVKDELKQKIEEEVLSENANEEVESEGGEEKTIVSTKKIAEAIRGITAILSRKLEIEEIELTEEDVEDLATALEPLQDELNEKAQYLPYLPLIIFVIAYAGRVLIAYDKKKKMGTLNAKSQNQ